MSLRLVLDMPNSNRNRKDKYFFVQGADWVYRREEWVIMPYGFENTWSIVKDLGLVPSAFSPFLHLFAMYLTSFVCFFFQLASVRK